MHREKVDVLVIGAGPSGTVAASMVNKQGLKVKIVEKQQFPRFVIGESLLPKCMDHLEEAGFLEVLKAQNYQVKKGARFIKDGKTCIFDFSEQYTKGWSWTWQVPREHFDKVLADTVQSFGVPIEYNSTVTGVDFSGENALVQMEGENGENKEIEARFVIDSSGYGRVLPRLLDLDQPSSMPPRWAFFTHVEDEKRPEGPTGQLITFVIHKKDFWLWVIPFSTGITSIGFVGNPDHFNGFEGSDEEKLRKMIDSIPQVRDRFRDVAFKFPPKSMKGYASSVKQFYGDKFALTGNSSEFLDPIFSSGVTFATESGLLAGKLASRQLLGEEVDWEKEYVGQVKGGVDTFRSYVNAWYEGTLQDIFFADDIKANMKIKNQICSVLAGYVWDKTNPYVKRHESALKTLHKVIQMEQKALG